MRWNTLTSLVALAILLAGITGSMAAQSASAKLRSGGTGERASSVTAKSPDSVAPSASGVASDYLIGPDDVLTVSVWKEPDLSGSVPVRPDGKITLPLVGDVEANGTTPTQLQEKIEKKLEEYVSKPVVTVIVKEPKSHKFNVIGEVQKPGTYLISGPMTVLDAIALAGGFRDWAKVKSIYILRVTAKGQERIHFNYNDVVKGKAPDIALKTRDTIVVP